MRSNTHRPLILIVFLFTLLNGASKLAVAQKYQRYQDAHTAVLSTIDDLDQVISKDPEHDKGRARARIVSAKKSLSDFDHGLIDNRFNRRSLNSAMGDIREVVNKNLLDAKERDRLLADLYNLRGLHPMSGK